MTRLSDRLNGLRWRLTATRRVWARGANPSGLFLPVDRSVVEPLGRIDGPGPGTSVPAGAVEVGGWVLFPSGPTARIEVSLGGEALGLARLGVIRPDIASRWEPPHAAFSGFELSVDLHDWEIGKERALEVVATSLAGERLEFEPVSISLEDAEQPKPLRKKRKDPLPPLPTRTPLARTEEGPRVLVFTHQLDLGGAQLYLLDLLRELARSHRGSFTMVSMIDGVLRKDIEALGIPVHISSVIPPDDLSSHIGRIEELLAWIEDREFDVALVNTATGIAFPGAEAARLLGIPVVWPIHESFPPSILWRGFDSEVRKRVGNALAHANSLVFEAEATQRMFERFTEPGRCVTLPYGLDFEPIDAARADFDPVAARATEGVPQEDTLVVCIGTIEPRKAQTMLAQAFDLIAAKHPHARLAFVGGKKDVNSEVLEACIGSCRHPQRIDLIPVTPDVDRWYGMADILVCASDVESLPRTVLEAMAWEVPVLATDVFGLPELITDGDTGWLCGPRDVKQLAEGLDRALSSTQEERRKIGRASRELVTERHSLKQYGSQIWHLLDSACKS